MSMRVIGFSGRERPAPAVLLAVGGGVAALAGLLGMLSVTHREYAVILALALLLIGIASVDMGVIALLAVPTSLVMVRVGGFLSVADVVLAAATILALLMVSAHELRPMAPLLWGGTAYLAALVPTLVLNPYLANYVEWLHELVLVLGSLVVGFVVGRRGHARAALSSYVLLSCALAVAAAASALIGYARTGALGPAYLPYLHKNFIGNALSVALVIAYARPIWVRWTRRWTYIAMLLCTVGIAASQSRQAMVGTIVGLSVVAVRPRVETGRRGRLVWFAALPAAVFVINALVTQLQSGNEFSSANQRLIWFNDSIDVWRQSPLVGVGLRWWYTDRFAVAFQPPNAEFEMLTSAGVIGLIAFVAMFSVAAWTLARMDPVYGTVALAVVLTRFTQGQFDLYWVAGQASLLWIVAGIAFGAQALDQSTNSQSEPPASQSAPPASVALGSSAGPFVRETT